MKISEKINILAGAIRSRAKTWGDNPADLTNRDINDFGEAQMHQYPDTIATEFYLECTDRQWQRVCNKVRKGCY